MRSPSLSRVALGFAGASLLLASCSSSSSPSAASLIQKSQAAVAGATALHYIDVTTIGAQSQSVTGSVSATQADVVLLLDKTPQLEVRLVGTTIYLQTTSASVLSSDLGLSSTVAPQWTSKWISVISGDAPYNTLLNAISITAEVNPFYPTASKATVLDSRTIKGIETTPLTANTTSASAAKDSTIFLNTKDLLPVAATVIAKSATATQTQEVVFQHWNVPFTVAVPEGATELSTIPTT